MAESEAMDVADQGPASRRLPPLLLEPTYGYAVRGDEPRRPTVGQCLTELWDSINLVRHPQRATITLVFLCLVGSFTSLVWFFARYATLSGVLFLAGSAWFVALGHHTLWLHRYCSHRSFTFSRPWLVKLVFWTYPLFLKEESYAVAHWVHHQRTDKAGDPYGPHLGWLGSFLATESIQKLNTAITEEQYALMRRRLSHLGCRLNSYQAFQRTGSVQDVRQYLARLVLAQLLWSSLAYLAGGVGFVLAWNGALFIVIALIRNFNWHGHRNAFSRPKQPGWEFDDSTALNQFLYGLLASEWHDNHHRFPSSLRTGFLRSQLDPAYLLVRLAHRLGAVSSYVDAKDRFDRVCLGRQAPSPTPGAASGA